MAGEAEQVRRLADEPMSFFPHDADAAQDVKCQRLIHRRGWDGYGRWWRLCEYMAAQSGHRIAFETEEDALILAGVLGFGGGAAFDDLIAVEECRSYVSELIDVGLLQRGADGLLENSRMQNNALYFGKQRHNGRKGGRPRKGSVASKSTGREA